MSTYDYESHIISIPDYPEPGVIFKDVTPLFKDPECFHAVVDDIAEHFADAGITKVIGAEARGFLVGTPVAYKLGACVACAQLAEKAGAKVAGFAFALELCYLHPREIIGKCFDQEVYTLIKVQ